MPRLRTRLSIGANIINLFDQAAVLNVFNKPYRDALGLTAEQFFAGFAPVAVAAANSRIRPDPQFGLDNGYQTPRSIMLQVKLTF